MLSHERHQLSALSLATERLELKRKRGEPLGDERASSDLPRSKDPSYPRGDYGRGHPRGYIDVMCRLAYAPSAS